MYIDQALSLWWGSTTQNLLDSSGLFLQLCCKTHFLINQICMHRLAEQLGFHCWWNWDALINWLLRTRSFLSDVFREVRQNLLWRIWTWIVKLSDCLPASWWIYDNSVAGVIKYICSYDIFVSLDGSSVDNWGVSPRPLRALLLLSCYTCSTPIIRKMRINPLMGRTGGDSGCVVGFVLSLPLGLSLPRLLCPISQCFPVF